MLNLNQIFFFLLLNYWLILKILSITLWPLQRPYSGEFNSENAYRKPHVVLKIVPEASRLCCLYWKYRPITEKIRKWVNGWSRVAGPISEFFLFLRTPLAKRKKGLNWNHANCYLLRNPVSEILCLIIYIHLLSKIILQWLNWVPQSVLKRIFITFFSTVLLMLRHFLSQSLFLAPVIYFPPWICVQ